MSLTVKSLHGAHFALMKKKKVTEGFCASIRNGGEDEANDPAHRFLHQPHIPPSIQRSEAAGQRMGVLLELGKKEMEEVFAEGLPEPAW